MDHWAPKDYTVTSKPSQEEHPEVINKVDTNDSIYGDFPMAARMDTTSRVVHGEGGEKHINPNGTMNITED